VGGRESRSVPPNGASGVPVDTAGRGRSPADLERQAFQQGLADAGIDIREFAAEVKEARPAGLRLAGYAGEGAVGRRSRTGIHPRA
jgi:hypothetical protein